MGKPVPINISTNSTVGTGNPTSTGEVRLYYIDATERKIKLHMQ